MEQIRFRSKLLLRTIALFVCALQVAATLAVVIQPARVALAASTIKGTVYQDYNANGTRDTAATLPNSGSGQISLAKDRGIAGVTVTAYDASGNAAGFDISKDDGTYTINATGTGPYRVEFTTLPTGFQPGPVGPNNGTSVRFLAGAASDIDLGILIPSEYCQNNPSLVTNCYRFGASNGAAADLPTLLDFPYTAGSNTFTTTTGAAEPTTHSVQFKVSQLGTTWGLAYARSSKRIYASAFYKKHAGFGPGGPNAIYVLDPATNNVVSTLTVPGPATNAHDTTNYDNDNGQIGFAAVGKTALGGIALSDDEKTIYVMNLENRTLYALNASDGSVIDSQVVPAQPPLLAPATVNACRVGDVRPFAVTNYRGKLYIGMVCSAESAPDADPDDTGVGGDGNGWPNWGDVRELQFQVYSVDPATLDFSAAPVFQGLLNYPRASAIGGGNTFWRPWTDDWEKAIPLAFESRIYAQPILSDITFENGNLILGVRDRFGDQTGLNLPFGNDGKFQEGVMLGATLRACGSPESGWTLEANGRCAGNGTQPPSTGHGPGTTSLTPLFNASTGFGSYYNVHRFETHSGDSFGGMAWIPGYPDFVNTGMRPAATPNSGGIYWMDAVRGNKVKGYQIYAGEVITQTPYTFGKANGMGDVLALCDSAPIEIGNRVWRDVNGNGIQDADENGIDSVTVELYRGGVKVGETTTANGGQYYFNASNVTQNGASGIVPGTGTQGGESAYEIRIPAGQANLAGLTPTITNASDDIRDSEGSPFNGGVRYLIPFAALASAGFTNHTFDFGFAEFDWGDLPDGNANGSPNYNTDSTGTAGPSHLIIPGLRIGAITDSEGNGQPNASATGDDVAGDDEDGVTLPTFSAGQPATVQVSAINTGSLAATLYGFIDFNDDGTFDDAGEIASVTVPAGTNSATNFTLTFNVPNNASGTQQVGARFRLSTQAGLGPDGGAKDGEVEDYLVGITIPGLSLGNKVFYDANNDGQDNDGPNSGISNVQVQVYRDTNGNGQFDAGDQLVGNDTTDDNGCYAVAGLAPTTGPTSAYLVVIPDSNFGGGGKLAGYQNSSLTPTTDSNADRDDDGRPAALNTYASGPVTLTIGGEPTLGAGEFDDGVGCNLGGVDANGNQTIDFGFYKLEVGNQVWYDANNNGSKDNGEAGIDGIVVSLLNEQGQQISNTTTKAGGFYTFTNLVAGVYQVSISNTIGYLSSSPDAGDPDTDTGDNNDNGEGSGTGEIKTAPFSLTPGSTNGGASVEVGTATTRNPNVDFGLFIPLNLGDLVWVDSNNNGLVDGGEPGIEGVTVQLFREGDDPTSATPLSTTTTSSTGIYNFANLTPGKYFVYIPNAPTQFPTSSDNTDANDNGEDDDDNGAQPGGSGTAVRSPVVELKAGTEPENDGDGKNGDLTIDFGFYGTVSVGDRVWFDNNGNGIQDNGETGVPGIKVTLYNATTGQPVTQDINGNPIVPATTDGNGNYLFANLPPGSYYVVFDLTTLPAGYSVTTPNAGADDTVDSDASPSDGKTAPVDVPSGSNLSLDMGIVQLDKVRVGDYVWFDDDQDGVQDGNETGVPGVVVTIYDANTNQPVQVNGQNLTKTTDINGLYLFDGLLAGNYYVIFDKNTLPNGFSITTPNAGNDDGKDSDADNTGKTGATGQLNPGQENLTLDMGIIAPYSVGNRVWLDKDNNGTLDNGEQGIDGVTVNLYLDANADGAPDGAAIDTTTTANGGYYRFDNRAAGTYIVEVVTPANHLSSTPNAGDPDVDVDDKDDNGSVAAGANIRSQPITLGPGSSEPTLESDLVANANPQGALDNRANMTVDFGFYQLAAIGDYVWRDQNKDGIQDANESPLGGWIVSLYTANGTLVATTTTNNNGKYLFTGLTPGAYFLEFAPPSNLGQEFDISPQDQGTNDGVDSDVNPTTRRTVATTLESGETDLTWDMGVFLLGTGLDDTDEPLLRRVFLPSVMR